MSCRVHCRCSEKVYPAGKFKNRVGYFPFEDHVAPTLPLIELFCRDVVSKGMCVHGTCIPVMHCYHGKVGLRMQSQWLGQHVQNVAVVHCKAGKGRTGCLVCAYLLYAKL